MDYYKNQTYYDILGIKQDASLENIQRAKDKLKFGNPDDRVPFSMWDKIDEAYAVLSDIQKRKEYDKRLEAVTDIYSDSDFFGSTSSNEESTETIEKPQVQNRKSNEVIEKPQVQNRKSNEVIEKPNATKSKSHQEKKDYDLNYTTNYNPENQEKNNIVGNAVKKVGGVLLSPVNKLVKLLKKPAIYAGGALVGFTVLGPVGAIGGIVATKLIRKFSKGKIRLIKNKKAKKISKISTLESQARQEYLTNLDIEINNLLSKPYNNYKLEILRVKYKNQIKLMQQMLDIRLKKNLKKGEFIFHKLKIMDIKMQLETAIKNLEKINQQIAEYQKEQRLSKTNKELIEVNKKLKEKDMKPLAVQKLKAYQSKLLRKRDKKATKIKVNVLRSKKIYDKVVRAKDFVVSKKYLFTPTEEIDKMIEVARNR